MTDRMPTSEELERWANEFSDEFMQNEDADALQAFLRSPRLKAALELAEAVEWVEANTDVVAVRDAYSWCVYRPSEIGSRMEKLTMHPTIPAAVAALRGKVEGAE